MTASAGARRARPAREHPLEFGMQFMTVRQARQRIVPRAMPDVLLGPAPRCDILDDDHRVAVGTRWRVSSSWRPSASTTSSGAGSSQASQSSHCAARMAPPGSVVASFAPSGGQRRIEHDFARRAEQLRGAPVRDHAALAVDHAGRACK